MLLTLGLSFVIAGLILLTPAALTLLLAPTPVPRLASPWPHVVVGLLTAAAVLALFVTL